MAGIVKGKGEDIIKFEGYEILRWYEVMYPDRLETLTEEEFQIMKAEKKRRQENGSIDDFGMYRYDCGSRCY